ncbi:MAG TPA: helix-turn-helix domain-containing protein [Thermoplasmata archaeon]|nr:helix-turn-helix domain-containing protein [Thermoplasmata archaeon]
MASDDLASLLFEIASGPRLAILEGVAGHPQRHAELARRIGLSGAETTRHLARLTRAGLLERGPDAAFRPTPLAEAVHGALRSLAYVAERQEYFLRHRVAGLPPGFSARIGELAQARWLADPFEVMAAQHGAIVRARERVWVLAESSFVAAQPAVAEKARAGVEVRLLLADRSPVATARLAPGAAVSRRIERAPVHLLITDRSASISFAGPDGRIDVSHAFQAVPDSGLTWAEELFEQLWARPAPRGRVGPVLSTAGAVSTWS